MCSSCRPCSRVLMAHISEDMASEDVSSVKFLLGNMLPRHKMENATVKKWRNLAVHSCVGGDICCCHIKHFLSQHFHFSFLFSQSFLDLIIELERLDKVSPQRMDFLEECFMHVGRVDLVKKLKVYNMSGEWCSIFPSSPLTYKSWAFEWRKARCPFPVYI